MTNLHAKFVNTAGKHAKNLYKLNWMAGMDYDDTTHLILHGLSKKYQEPKIREDVVKGIDVLGKTLEKFAKQVPEKIKLNSKERSTYDLYCNTARILSFHPEKKINTVKTLKIIGKYLNKLLKTDLELARGYAGETNRLITFWEPNETNSNPTELVKILGKYTNKLNDRTAYTYIYDSKEIRLEIGNEWNPEDTLKLLGKYTHRLGTKDEEVGFKFVKRAPWTVYTSHKANVNPAEVIAIIGGYAERTVRDRETCMNYINDAPNQLFDVEKQRRGSIEKLKKYSQEKLGDIIKKFELEQIEIQNYARMHYHNML
jgi:hypothetical protein